MSNITPFPGKLDDQRPLPEQVIYELGGTMVYIDTPKHERLYSVRDWVFWVSGSKSGNRSVAWSKLKAKLTQENSGTKGFPFWKTLEFDTQGGVQLTDYANENGLYQITQRMSDKSLSVRRVKKFLADAGVKIDQYRRDPAKAIEDAYATFLAQGFSEEEAREKATVRVKGINERKAFADTALETHVTQSPHYGRMTNAEYEVLFGAAKDELVRILGLTSTQSNKMRDHISTLALKAIEAAEIAASMKMRQLGRKLTSDEQVTIVRDCTKLVAPAFWNVAEYTGTDLLTGNPLLSDDNDTA